MKKATFSARGALASAVAALTAAIVAFVVAGGSLASAATACANSVTPESLWPSTVPANPTSSDVNAVTLGLHFKTAEDGQVNAVRFYKGTGNTGTHVGSLWTSSGTLLESVTFVNETSSGWQTAYFSSPLNITANTDYVVSYFAPAAHYADTQYYAFPFTNVDLTATASDYHYGTSPAFPTSTYRSTNYWVDVVFTPTGSSPSPSPSNTSASPSPSPTTASPSASPSDSPSTSPSSSPSTSPSPSSSPTGTGTTTYVQPGTVGYLGNTSDLTVYQPGGAAPSGCSWLSYGLRCNNDDYTWDHVWIKGGVYWTGLGLMKVTNSIIQGSSANGWYALLGHPASSTAVLNANAGFDVENSTLGWLPGDTEPSGEDVAPVWSLYGNQPLTLKYDDLSGMPQGTDPGANSVIEYNWIHNLNQNGPSSTPSHLDGVYSQGGGNILIQGNYVDVPVRSDTTAAIFIQDRGSTDTGISIIGNYLNGGAYTLRNQTGINVDVENNTFGQNLYGFVGDLSGYPGTYGTWSGNVDTSGNIIPKP